MMKMIAYMFGLMALLSTAPPALAQDEDLRPRALVGRYIQLDPIMIPFQTARGIRYEIVTVRMVVGEKSTARYACFVAPMLHEQIMFFLWEKGVTTADFEGDRKVELANKILAYVSDKTDERYYEAIEFAGGYEEIDEDSQNLSNLCK
jgi:hypothetical protein